MTDFFKDLEQHIEHGWDDIKDAVRNDFMTPAKEDSDALAAGIVEGMVKGDTLTSPVASTIAVIAQTPGHLGITFADEAGFVVVVPEDEMKDVEILVKKGDVVAKGTPLMKFAGNALANATVDLVLPLKEKAPDGRTEEIVRVYGPIKAE